MAGDPETHPKGQVGENVAILGLVGAAAGARESWGTPRGGVNATAARVRPPWRGFGKRCFSDV